jgi:hypothetical protein
MQKYSFIEIAKFINTYSASRSTRKEKTERATMAKTKSKRTRKWLFWASPSRLHFAVGLLRRAATIGNSGNEVAHGQK